MSLPLAPAPDKQATDSSAANQGNGESLGHPSSSLQAPDSHDHHSYNPSNSPTSTINNDHAASGSDKRRPVDLAERRGESNWGNSLSVGHPLSKDDPNFLTLQRSLTRSRHDEQEWSLRKQLEGVKKTMDDQGTGEKRQVFAPSFPLHRSPPAEGRSTRGDDVVSA